jgi:hypothetical protein
MLKLGKNLVERVVEVVTARGFNSSRQFSFDWALIPACILLGSGTSDVGVCKATNSHHGDMMLVQLCILSVNPQLFTIVYRQ